MRDIPLHYRVAFIASCAILAGLFAWMLFYKPPEPVGTTVVATPAPEVAKVPKVNIKPPAVKVYAPAAKDKLNLPDQVRANAFAHVLSSSAVKADDHPHTITTVLDEQTGEVIAFDRRDPLPWLAGENSGEIRVDYGIKNGMTRVGRLSLRESLVQVKALHLGGQASIDTDGQYFVGVGVGWKF